MKVVRCLSIVLSVALLSGCTLLNKPAEPIDVGPEIAPPIVLDEALITLTVSDVHGFLDAAGTIVAQFSPMMGAPMIKMVIGNQLGDPQLAGFAPGKGLAVVMLDASNTFAVAEVEAAQSDAYVQGLQGKGFLTRTMDGLVLIGKTAGQLNAAERLAQTVQAELLDAKRSPSVRIALQPAEMIAKNEEVITAGLKKMVDQMQQASASNEMAGVQKILEAEMKVFLSLGRQIDSVEVEIQAVDGSIHVREVVQPMAGSRFSAFCNAPALNDFNPALHSSLLGDGAVNMEFCIRNPRAYSDFIAGECAALEDVMSLDKSIMEGWVSYMERWMSIMKGTVCETVLTGSGTPIGMGYLIEINDEAETLAVLRSIETDIGAMGLLRLYEALGMPLSVEFKENIRKHAGVKIHQLKIDLSMEEMPAEQRKTFESMMGNMTYSMAIYKGALIYTMGEGEIGDVIDQMKKSAVSPAPLAARGTFLAGAICYADFDAGKYFEFISAMMKAIPDAPESMQKFGEIFKGADPVVMSGFCNSGRFESRSQIPGSLLVRLAQAGQMMVMENMQKQAAMQTEKKKQKPEGPVPEGTLNLLDGSEVQLSSHIGKQVVVLDFWASWCGPCRKGLPVVQQVSEQFAGMDVVFYAVNLREDESSIKTFLAANGITLPVAMDDGKLSEAFGVSGIPHTVIIGKGGNIQSVHTGFSPELETQLSADISAALAE